MLHTLDQFKHILGTDPDAEYVQCFHVIDAQTDEVRVYAAIRGGGKTLSITRDPGITDILRGMGMQ